MPQTEDVTDLRMANADRLSREAQSAAVGCCCAAGLILLLGCWLAVQGCKALWRAATAPAYPDPVCEACGAVLDGTHATCQKSYLTQRR